MDAHGAADASIDEVAIGEADVRLVRGQAGAVQPLTQRRSLLGVSQLHAADAGAMQRPEPGRHEPGACGVRAQPVGVLDVEVRDCAAVAHEERATVLEPAVQMDDCAPVGAGGDVGGVEEVADEPAHRVPARSCVVIATAARFHRLRGSRESDDQPWWTDCRMDPRIPGVAATERQPAARHAAHGRPDRRNQESSHRPCRTPGAVSQESLASRRDAQIGRGPVRAGSAKARSMDWNDQREHRDGRRALSLHQIGDARRGRTPPTLDRFLRTSLCFDGLLERVPRPGLAGRLVRRWYRALPRQG